MPCIDDCNTARDAAEADARTTRDNAIAAATTTQQIIDAENAYLKAILGASRAHADCLTNCPTWAGGAITDISSIYCDNAV